MRRVRNPHAPDPKAKGALRVVYFIEGHYAFSDRRRVDADALVEVPEGERYDNEIVVRSDAGYNLRWRRGRWERV